MKTLLALVIVGGLSTAAHAQATRWPVTETGGSCSIAQTVVHPEFGPTRIEIAYDAANHQVTLASTNKVGGPLPSSGDLQWTVVFLDNQGEKYDDQWGPRTFTYAPDGDAYRFETAFAGEKNVRQFFADMANSRAIGLVKKRELIVGYDLEGAKSAIARLGNCAQKVVASQ